MPDEAAHLAQAGRNQRAIDHLLISEPELSDWVATVAFYKALHWVEAVFANDSAIRHGQNHENRDGCLKRSPSYSHIYKHYRPLWTASVVARYLQNTKTGDDFNSFDQYMTSDKVRSELLDHRLKQVEQSARKFLSEEGKKIL